MESRHFIDILILAFATYLFREVSASNRAGAFGSGLFGSGCAWRKTRPRIGMLGAKRCARFSVRHERKTGC